ncbi:cellulose binding domain-containing protein [Streptomyces sp. NPDC001100]
MRRASLRAVLTATLMLGGMATTATPAAHAADNTGLIASFGITSTWGAGFEGGYTVTNKSTHTVSSWTITFTLPATEAVTWNLRGCPGLQAGEESDSCGAGQGKPNRPQ